MSDWVRANTPPPSSADEFPVTVLLVTVNGKLPSAKTPPPSDPDPAVEFPLTVLPVNVTKPSLENTPPPDELVPAVEFSLIVLLDKVNELKYE